MLFLIATMDLLALKSPVTVSMDTTSMDVSGLLKMKLNQDFRVRPRSDADPFTPIPPMIHMEPSVMETAVA